MPDLVLSPHNHGLPLEQVYCNHMVCVAIHISAGLH